MMKNGLKLLNGFIVLRGLISKSVSDFGIFSWSWNLVSLNSPDSLWIIIAAVSVCIVIYLIVCLLISEGWVSTAVSGADLCLPGAIRRETTGLRGAA